MNIHAQVLVIELLGGEVAELILHPDRPSLGAKHDQIEANAFAKVAVAASPAVAALIAYCEAEAAALIRANIEIAHALVAALIEHGILAGDQIDAIIAREVAAKALANECAPGRLEDCREKRG
jgi:ATP-dependent Zn protease